MVSTAFSHTEHIASKCAHANNENELQRSRRHFIYERTVFTYMTCNLSRHAGNPHVTALLTGYGSWLRIWVVYKISTLLIMKLTVSNCSYCDSLRFARKFISTKVWGGESNPSTIILVKTTSGRSRCTVRRNTLLQLASEPLRKSITTMLNYYSQFSQSNLGCFYHKDCTLRFSTAQHTFETPLSRAISIDDVVLQERGRSWIWERWYVDERSYNL